MGISDTLIVRPALLVFFDDSNLSQWYDIASLNDIVGIQQNDILRHEKIDQRLIQTKERLHT